jgi:hypothetical protein
MLDRILAIGSAFNWISPLIAGIKDITNGPSHTFLIYEECGWSVNEIVRLLRRHGIKTWGHMIVNNNIMITVRKAQAQWAQYLLERERIPIEYGLVKEPNSAGSQLKQKGKSQDPLEEALSWVDDLVDSFNF